MVDHFHTSTFHCALVGVTFVVAAADWFKRSGPCIYTDERFNLGHMVMVWGKTLSCIHFFCPMDWTN